MGGGGGDKLLTTGGGGYNFQDIKNPIVINFFIFRVSPLMIYMTFMPRPALPREVIKRTAERTASKTG